MPVVLLGALGGMVSAGIIGLFLGGGLAGELSGIRVLSTVGAVAGLSLLLPEFRELKESQAGAKGEDERKGSSS